MRNDNLSELPFAIKKLTCEKTTGREEKNRSKNRGVIDRDV
jgi:hypothetical protein